MKCQTKTKTLTFVNPNERPDLVIRIPLNEKFL